MARKILNIYTTVIKLLVEDKRYRDSDERLVARIWNDEIQKHDERNISAYDFFCLYAKNKITNSDSITRARRKAQQEHPELRGATWLQRQTKETEDTKQELRTL